MMRIATVVALAVIILGASGCASNSDRPARTVEAQLQALVSRDEARFTALTCAEKESQALIEYDSFGLVEAELKGATCTMAGSEGEAALVRCSGSIEASYGGEVRSFDLSARTYHVLPHDGDWLVCGYTK